ncbi:glycosyltransferase [Tropicimonas sediminicola]|uniref:Glycosyltransferase family 28 C-terminal domain-containing protein n=1 Tax=Tropicimonas sediminicola TaxID=1031541 RepID=A0A239K366_9RHOB|nr:glycosyltransferase [Tropicimonas sediminicola]SNT12169.1 Glycosyltransferase family 28 C-terminal domain-containing protein [Tropicimonas sediminicola]
MIVVAAGTRNVRSYDAQLAFAAQLAARGHAVCIDAASLPEKTGRSRTYEAASYLADRAEIAPEAVFILGAEDLGERLLATLWDYGLGPDVPVVATGRFADLQAYLAAKAKLAYAIGREAVVIDLAESQPRPMIAEAVNPLVAELAPVPRPAVAQPVVTILLGQDTLEEPDALSCLSSMNQRREFRLRVIASGKQKEQIKSTVHRDLEVLLLTDLSPVAHACKTDIFAVFGHGVPGERMASVSVSLMAAGGVVVDCTEDRAIVDTGAPALRGPESLVALDGYLSGTVVPTLSQIADQVTRSPWLRSVDIARLELAAGLAPAEPPLEPQPRRTMFFPTNGVGLGHAQRCAVIAEAMPARSATFAAFPSCVPMILRRGFDCMPLVSRSDTHDEPHANDVLTYRRLSQALRRRDQLVFDGGFVFDSIFRTVLEKDLLAVWIRRGLWPDGTSARIALDREHIFERIIVPSEPFEELNDHYSFGAKVHMVGPIVKRTQQTPEQREAFREGLRERFGRRFDRLVVSMLGGGVASDRAAQLQMISSALSDRDDCLHLILVWPGSVVAPALHGWPNTHVVQTLEATALGMAADFVLSAAGYNSVGEILYHQIPAIFIPQSAPYLDNQTRRAQALAERGLGAMVEETEFLRLERCLRDFLDGTAVEQVRSALGQAELPSPGADEAARLIAAQLEGR